MTPFPDYQINRKRHDRYYELHNVDVSNQENIVKADTILQFSIRW